MMKNNFLFLLMALALGVGIGFAFAMDQTVTAEIGEIVQISVNNISYGTIIPNSHSDQNSIITVGEENNVDLNVNINVTTDDSGLFQHIIFDIENNNFDDNTEIGSGIITIPIDDNSGDNTIPTRLQVPSGFSPGVKTGVIGYIAMKRI